MEEEQHVHIFEGTEARQVGHSNDLIDNDQLLQFSGNNSITDEPDIVHFSWSQINYDPTNKYKDTDILLDTGSTFSVFKNLDMLLSIRNSRRKMTTHTNRGTHDSSQIAKLPIFITVWYNLSSMINILLFLGCMKKVQNNSGHTKSEIHDCTLIKCKNDELQRGCFRPVPI